MNKRKNPDNTMRTRLFEKNAYSCCVCKEHGIGLNLHHLDGDSSNTVDENLAVLCVKEHDVHHRPNAYSSLKHLELTTDELKKYKHNWELFVEECKKDVPNVLATVNVFGTKENIVGMKLVFQWANGKIEFEKEYQLLDAAPNEWVDMALSEVSRLGKNIKVVVIDNPLPIEYCEKCHNAYSRTIDECATYPLTTSDWAEKSISTVFINPHQSSLAISIFYGDKSIYSISMHKCNGMLHLNDYKGDELIHFSKRASIRMQVTKYIRRILAAWNTGHTFIGTGDYDKPTIIPKIVLPLFWEH
jgi:hypothetical protein